jgi:hypothetical protein
MPERSQERGFYRVEYPGGGRPRLYATGAVLNVIDCSETGLRYELPGGEPPPPLGSEVRGVVRFRPGAETAIEGVVVRVSDGAAALRLTGEGIPLRTILAEQRYLRSHYLGHLQDRP